MSIPERVFRISKAYLNQVRDRIDSELSDAEHELDTTASSASPGGIDAPDEERRSSVYRDSDPEAMMRRAEERIAAARRDLESRTEVARAAGGAESSDAPKTTIASSVAAPSSAAPRAAMAGTAAEQADPNYHDYRVLGVPPGSDLAQVQSEYEKLSRRLDPTRLSFPEGSTEQKQAAQIMERITTAYEALRRRLDPTENRFGKLELE